MCTLGFVLSVFFALWLLCGFCAMCFCCYIDWKCGAELELVNLLLIVVGGLFSVYYAVDAFTAMDDDPFIE